MTVAVATAATLTQRARTTIQLFRFLFISDEMGGAKSPILVEICSPDEAQMKRGASGGISAPSGTDGCHGERRRRRAAGRVL